MRHEVIEGHDCEARTQKEIELHTYDRTGEHHQCHRINITITQKSRYTN